jgi:hypothetical protein
MNNLAPITSSIDFAIRSHILRRSDITGLLGIEPTRAFEKDEEYEGLEKVGEDFRPILRRRPWGVWHFETAQFVQRATPIEVHAQFLLAKIEPANAAIEKLLADMNYRVLVTIWYVGPGGFGLSSSTVMRLAALSHEIGITCWDTEEAT